jgi:hypothetical protein
LMSGENREQRDISKAVMTEWSAKQGQGEIWPYALEGGVIWIRINERQ